MASKEREYRSMELRIQKREEGVEPSFFVEGYASTFQPYVLMTVDDIDYSERIEPNVPSVANRVETFKRLSERIGRSCRDRCRY